MSSYDNLLAKINSLSAKLTTIIDLEDKVNNLTTSYNELKETCDSLKKEVQHLTDENRNLKTQVLKSNNEIAQLKAEYNDLEQYSRRDCLEIRGIPFDKDEDTTELVQKVAELIDVDLHDEDISISHRLNNGVTTRDDGVQIVRDPAIIVKFTKRSDRDDVYNGRKLLKNKSTRDLGFKRHREQPIFISESLTKKNKTLFNKCLKVKKDRNFKFIWTRYGKIHLRKDINHPVITITKEEDLSKLNLDNS